MALQTTVSEAPPDRDCHTIQPTGSRHAETISMLGRGYQIEAASGVASGVDYVRAKTPSTWSICPVSG